MTLRRLTLRRLQEEWDELREQPEVVLAEVNRLRAVAGRSALVLGHLERGEAERIRQGSELAVVAAIEAAAVEARLRDEALAARRVALAAGDHGAIKVWERAANEAEDRRVATLAGAETAKAVLLEMTEWLVLAGDGSEVV